MDFFTVIHNLIKVGNEQGAVNINGFYWSVYFESSFIEI